MALPCLLTLLSILICSLLANFPRIAFFLIVRLGHITQELRICLERWILEVPRSRLIRVRVDLAIARDF